MNSLFDYPYCSICGEMLAPKQHAGSVLDGFRDGDTGQIVHLKSSCRELHYEQKQKRLGTNGVTYSEYPMTIEQWLNRHNKKKTTQSNTK